MAKKKKENDKELDDDGNTDDGDNGNNGDGDNDDDDDDDETTPKTLEDALAALGTLGSEFSGLRKRLAEVNSEAKQRRLKLKAFEEAEDKRRKEQLSTEERLTEERDEAKKAVEAAQKKLHESRVRHAVELEAAVMKFIDAHQAYVLTDLSGIEYDEDSDELSGVKDALKKLAKDSQHLLDDESEFKKEKKVKSPGTPRTRPARKKGGAIEPEDDPTVKGRKSVSI